MSKSRFVVGLVAIVGISAICVAADDAITLIAGRELHVQFITELSSKANESGDMWTGKVVVPVFGHGGEIVPDGSTVDGHIMFVNSPESSQRQEQGQREGRFSAHRRLDLNSGRLEVQHWRQCSGWRRYAAQRSGKRWADALASKFSAKKGKTILVAAGTEVIFEITHDTVATKVPVKQ